LYFGIPACRVLAWRVLLVQLKQINLRQPVWN